MAEKIFLLEDDAYLRDGLLEMLQGRDYEVESAESIKKAEIIIKENRFSLLIFDVMLSDGSSFVLREIKDCVCNFLTCSQPAQILGVNGGII